MFTHYGDESWLEDFFLLRPTLGAAASNTVWHPRPCWQPAHSPKAVGQGSMLSMKDETSHPRHPGAPVLHWGRGAEPPALLPGLALGASCPNKGTAVLWGPGTQRRQRSRAKRVLTVQGCQVPERRPRL